MLARSPLTRWLPVSRRKGSQETISPASHCPPDKLKSKLYGIFKTKFGALSTLHIITSVKVERFRPSHRAIQRKSRAVEMVFQMFWSAMAPLREAGKLGMQAIRSRD